MWTSSYNSSKMFRALIAMTLAGIISGELFIINLVDNSTEISMVDLELQFTAALPENGVTGQIVTAYPDEACDPILPPPFPSNSSVKWFVLIRRCPCNMETKVLHAQEAGFDGVVIYNVGAKCSSVASGRDLDTSDSKFSIPGILIGESDGMQINKSYQYDKGYVIAINPESPFNLNNYLLPFAVVIGISFLVMLVFMIVKCIKDRRRNRRNRLSSRHLKQLPTQKFKKGDPYDVCAVCLEEYCEGEKIRILPCAHAYHTKCIDPWLTNNRRTCPVCKRKVALKGYTPDSESDSDEEAPSERTPLIRSGQIASRTDGGTFSGNFLTSTPSLSEDNVRDASRDNGSDSSSGEIYQSAVCQQSPPGGAVDIGEAIASSSAQLMAPAAHSINSEDGSESGGNASPSQNRQDHQVSVHVQTADGSNGKKRKQDMVV